MVADVAGVEQIWVEIVAVVVAFGVAAFVAAAVFAVRRPPIVVDFRRHRQFAHHVEQERIRVVVKRFVVQK